MPGLATEVTLDINKEIGKETLGQVIAHALTERRDRSSGRGGEHSEYERLLDKISEGHSAFSRRDLMFAQVCLADAISRNLERGTYTQSDVASVASAIVKISDIIQ